MFQHDTNEKFKSHWKQSLASMGNVAAKPDKIKVIGIKEFDGQHLIMKCDPAVSPINYKIMGRYYRKLTEWLYAGNKIEDFESDLYG